jgi:tetratricopeptide (TPR) repeat protein
VFGARIRARAEPRALEGSGERYSTRLYNVPQPSQSFVGRSRELSALRAQLLGPEARLSVSVEGLPGIGKTELVLQLAHQLALEGHFPGGIFWFAAESKDLLVAWASEAVAGALDASGGSIQERAQSAVNAVSRSGLRSLVILDNVESWSEAERPTPLPIGVHVTLLVTTRARRLGGSRFRALPLAFLSDDEAQLLLRTVAGPDVDSRPGFDALLEHLCGYTLAVELAATYLSEYPETSPAEYLALLGAGKEHEADAAHFTRYEHTVNDAFALLWARLDARVRARWELAACFAPEPVSSALSDAVGLDAEGRRELRRYHLIEMDSEGSWRMHRLTRAFAHAAGDESSRARATEAFVSGVVARAAPMELATAFRTYAPDRAHFDAAVGLARADAKAIRSCELFASIACAMHSMGELEPARELLELAVAGDLQNFGEEHENVATLRSNLANLLQDLGELSTALTLLEKALASDLAHRADNHFKILLRRNNLALLHQHMGNPEKGREVLAPALEASLPVLGEDHQMVAIARSNLGAILTDLGEFDAAEAMLRSSLDSDLRRHGEEHPYPAIRRFRLANLCEARGDLPGAIALLEVVIRSEQAVRGPSHPRLALARAALAAVLH